MTIVYIVGVVLQVVGISIAGVGLRRIWREFGGDDRYVGPVVDRARAAFATARRFIRRLLRRRGDNVVALTGSGHVSITAHAAQVRVDYGPLPADQDVAVSIAALDERTQRIMSALNDTTAQLANDVERRRQETAGLEGRLADAVRELQERTRLVAVGGARLEGLGLFLVAVGVVVQGVAGAVD